MIKKLHRLFWDGMFSGIAWTLQVDWLNRFYLKHWLHYID